MEFRNSFDSAFGVVKYDFTESNFLDYQVTEIYSSCRKNCLLSNTMYINPKEDIKRFPIYAFKLRFSL